MTHAFAHTLEQSAAPFPRCGFNRSRGLQRLPVMGAGSVRRVSVGELGRAASFEEDRQPFLASATDLSGGGTVSLTSPGGRRPGLRSRRRTLVRNHRGKPNYGEGPLLIGPAENWRWSSHFERIRYPQIYSGIDLIFITNAGRLDHNFEVTPHADPGIIRMHYEDAKVALDGDGNLQVSFQAPQCFNGARRRPRLTVSVSVRSLATIE